MPADTLQEADIVAVLKEAKNYFLVYAGTTIFIVTLIGGLLVSLNRFENVDQKLKTRYDDIVTSRIYLESLKNYLDQLKTEKELLAEKLQEYPQYAPYYEKYRALSVYENATERGYELEKNAEYKILPYLPWFSDFVEKYPIAIAPPYPYSGDLNHHYSRLLDELAQRGLTDGEKDRIRAALLFHQAVVSESYANEFMLYFKNDAVRELPEEIAALHNRFAHTVTRCEEVLSKIQSTTEKNETIKRNIFLLNSIKNEITEDLKKDLEVSGISISLTNLAPLSHFAILCVAILFLMYFERIEKLQKIFDSHNAERIIIEFDWFFLYRERISSILSHLLICVPAFYSLSLFIVPFFFFDEKLYSLDNTIAFQLHEPFSYALSFLSFGSFAYWGYRVFRVRKNILSHQQVVVNGYVAQ